MDGTDKGIVTVIVSFFLAFFALLFIIGCFFVVSPGEQGIIFNRISGMKEITYSEGMHFKVPLLEQAIKMNIRVQKQEEDASAATKDLQDVKTKVAVNFKVDKNKVHEVYRTIGKSTTKIDYMQTEIINPIIQESVKVVTARYTAEELIQKRDIAKQQIDELIKQRLATHNILVLDVSITNFEFSQQFSLAIEKKAQAVQQVGEALQILERIKVEKEQKIVEAEGDAAKIRLVQSQLEKSPKYVEFLAVQKWNGVAPLVVGSSSYVLPLNNMAMTK